MTPAGIEPATFRFVAQYLNHCATAKLNFVVQCNLRIYEDGKIRLEFSLLWGFEPRIVRLHKVIQAVF